QRRVAMITGASRGIGRGIAIELARSGFDIAGVSRGTKADELKTEIERLESQFLHVLGDVSILDDHEKMISLVLEKFGRIDVLVNNAGVAPEKRLDILETTEQSFDRVLNINLRGPFFLTQKVATQMIKQRDAVETHHSIVFITSVSA